MGVKRFVKKGKCNLRYVGPFQIMEKIGPMANIIALLEYLRNLHGIFHLSSGRGFVNRSLIYSILTTSKFNPTLRTRRLPLKFWIKKS